MFNSDGIIITDGESKENKARIYDTIDYTFNDEPIYIMYALEAKEKLDPKITDI